MSVHLVADIQKNLGYAPLGKIDPNEGNIPIEGHPYNIAAIAQAAIPAILCGFSDYVRKDEGARIVLEGTTTADFLQLLFGDQKNELITRVADYSKTDYFDTEKEMQHIANEAEKIILKHFSDPADYQTLREFFAGQRHEILSYLPVYLHVGDILRHDTLDDDTHKMEGPVSSFMHGVEKYFNE
jgi:hypothetical protein